MRLPILLFLTISAFAQDPFEAYYAPVRDHLQLSQAQITRIQKNGSEYYEWEKGKRQRAQQVYEEIGIESAREVLTPGALGVRWAELETIRRQVAERRKALHQANQSVLTDAQRLKFKGIEDAVKLDPVIASARFASLMPQGPSSCGPQDSLFELLRDPSTISLCLGGSSFGQQPPGPESMRRIERFLRR